MTVHGLWRNELRVNRVSATLAQRAGAFAVGLVERRYLARLRYAIAITGEIEGIVRRASPSAVVTRIDNPIDQQFFSLGDASVRPTVLIVGWVTRRKGVDSLLRATERLRERVPGLEVRVAGAQDQDPEFVASLRSEFAQGLADGRIHLLGPISQEALYDEMARCSVFCLPSLAESAPMVISQAMAAGKPVVASRVGGIPQMVDDGQTGRLCVPADVDSIAAGLGDVLGDLGRARAMGQRGRELAAARHSYPASRPGQSASTAGRSRCRQPPSADEVVGPSLRAVPQGAPDSLCASSSPPCSSSRTPRAGLRGWPTTRPHGSPRRGTTCG